jgi:hypothetical protein
MTRLVGIFWFFSAMCRLPKIKCGVDELDNVTELSEALAKNETDGNF